VVRIHILEVIIVRRFIPSVYYITCHKSQLKALFILVLFQHVSAPKSFIRLTRITQLDVSLTVHHELTIY